jgi:hypothetical protein
MGRGLGTCPWPGGKFSSPNCSPEGAGEEQSTAFNACPWPWVLAGISARTRASVDPVDW